MKKEQLKFMGNTNGIYNFSSDTGVNYRFSKVRADLIYQFDLSGKTNLHQWFMVSYFKTSDKDNDVFIISDLELK